MFLNSWLAITAQSEDSEYLFRIGIFGSCMGAFYTCLVRDPDTRLIWLVAVGVQVGSSHRHNCRHLHGDSGLEHSCGGSAAGGCCAEHEPSGWCMVHHDLPAHDNRSPGRYW